MLLAIRPKLGLLLHHRAPIGGGEYDHPGLQIPSGFLGDCLEYCDPHGVRFGLAGC